MSFPTNPSGATIAHSEGNKVWTYSGGVWTLERGAHATIIDVDGSGVNAASGWWQTAITNLNKPIYGGGRAYCHVEFYTDFFKNIDVSWGHVQVRYYLFDAAGTQIATDYYRFVTADNGAIRKFYTGWIFHLAVRNTTSTVATKIRMRVDWNIPQQQSGNWVQWSQRYMIISP